MTDREAIKMALEWMEVTHHTAMTTYSDEAYEEHCKIERELRQALAQPEQEPVAFIEQLTGKPKLIGGYVVRTDADIPLYMTPSKREWVGLHLDDMPEEHVVDRSFLRGARWAEVKLKEKNT